MFDIGSVLKSHGIGETGKGIPLSELEFFKNFPETFSMPILGHTSDKVIVDTARGRFGVYNKDGSLLISVNLPQFYDRAHFFDGTYIYVRNEQTNFNYFRVYDLNGNEVKNQIDTGAIGSSEAYLQAAAFFNNHYYVIKKYTAAGAAIEKINESGLLIWRKTTIPNGFADLRSIKTFIRGGFLYFISCEETQAYTVKIDINDAITKYSGSLFALNF